MPLTRYFLVLTATDSYSALLTGTYCLLYSAVILLLLPLLLLLTINYCCYCATTAIAAAATARPTSSSPPISNLQLRLFLQSPPTAIAILLQNTLQLTFTFFSSPTFHLLPPGPHRLRLRLRFDHLHPRNIPRDSSMPSQVFSS